MKDVCKFKIIEIKTVSHFNQNLILQIISEKRNTRKYHN